MLLLCPLPIVIRTAELVFQFFPLYSEVIDVKKILTIEPTVYRFSNEQSLQINDIILEGAERLVNRLNERNRQNMIDYAMREVESAQKIVKEASEKMTDQAPRWLTSRAPKR